MTGAALVAFVENALEVDVADIEKLIRDRPQVLLTGRARVCALLHDAWRRTDLAELQAAKPIGQLWPVASSESGDALDVAKRTAGVWMPGTQRLAPPAAADETQLSTQA